MKGFLLFVFLLAPSFVFANENLYKEKWCKDKRGKVNQVVSGVIVDCLTKGYAVEISKLTTWGDLIDKAEIVRSSVPGKRTGVVVIYDKNKNIEFQQFKAVAKAKNITVWKIGKYYLDPPTQVKKKTVSALKSKNKASKRRTYFRPKNKIVKTPPKGKPVINKPQIVIKTVTNHTVVTKEVTLSRKVKPPIVNKSSTKPWLGDGIVDLLR